MKYQAFTATLSAAMYFSGMLASGSAALTPVGVGGLFLVVLVGGLLGLIFEEAKP